MGNKELGIDKNFNFHNYDNYFDLILTFRNIQNFLTNKSDNIFSSINKSLKKGGYSCSSSTQRADTNTFWNLVKVTSKNHLSLIK